MSKKSSWLWEGITMPLASKAWCDSRFRWIQGFLCQTFASHYAQLNELCTWALQINHYCTTGEQNTAPLWKNMKTARESNIFSRRMRRNISWKLSRKPELDTSIQTFQVILWCIWTYLCYNPRYRKSAWWRKHVTFCFLKHLWYRRDRTGCLGYEIFRWQSRYNIYI